MKNKSSWEKGFTLIELLVVVLIIGILASVALPQYQKAVKKSKLTQLGVAMDAAKKGVELYVLSNGYPTEHTLLSVDPSPLDIEIPGEYNVDCHCYRSKYGGVWVSADPNRADIVYNSQNVSSGSSKWFDRTYFESFKRSGTGTWVIAYVESDTNDSLAIICRWFKENGYRVEDPAATECAGAGVTL